MLREHTTGASAIRAGCNMVVESSKSAHKEKERKKEQIKESADEREERRRANKKERPRENPEYMNYVKRLFKYVYA